MADPSPLPRPGSRACSLAWRLRRAAVRLDAERVELQHLMDLHGPGGHGTLLLLLAAPCVLPVPGVGTVLGFGIAALAWAMWCGQAGDALPGRVARLTLPRLWARRVLVLLARLHASAARWSRPRCPAVARHGLRSWIPLLVAWMAVLIILPIPFGNLLPALALILLGVGLGTRDGLLIVSSAGTGALATLFPVALALGAETALTGVLGWLS